MVVSLTHSPPQLHYTCAGHGRDILLIHGWASSARMWERLVHDLCGEARCWSVDLYGFGASPRPPLDDLPTIERHTTLLLDFCDRHGIRPAVIVGHSMGGMLALKLALARPAWVERLVLLAPVVTGRFGSPVELNRLVNSEWGNFVLARSRPFWRLTQNILVPLFRSIESHMGGAGAERRKTDFRRAHWHAAAYAVDSIARENLGPHLAKIHQPTLVIAGQRDLTVPPREARLTAAGLPNAQLLELPRVAHQPLDEAPEAVIRAVRAFLRTD